MFDSNHCHNAVMSPPTEYAVLTSNGDLVYMVNPTSEVVLASGVISDQERLIHSEFFDNRPGLKTPDRYLRIRTYITDSWYAHCTCIPHTYIHH